MKNWRGSRRRGPLVVVALLALSVAALATACSGAGPDAPSRVDSDDAVVIVQCNVSDAELWVDDRFIAEVGRLRRGIALGPGDHRLELRHDRYHTHYAEISVQPRERRTIAVELVEALP